MKTKHKEVYSEVYSVLQLLGQEYINKLPKELYKQIQEERLENYNPQYTEKIFETVENISQESIAMLALLYLNYWCSSEEEKQELQKMFNENEKKYQEELREKYNPENIFKQKTTEPQKEEQQETALIVYKENFIQKIWNKIKNLLWKK